VSGISDEDLAGLENWRAFYHSDYSYVGILAGGRFYDAAGEALPPVARVQARTHWHKLLCLLCKWVTHSYTFLPFSLQAAVASARITRAAAAAADALTPSCAASWTADDGGAVWCESPNHVPRRVIDTTTSPPAVLKCGCMPLAGTGEAQGNSGDYAEEDGAILKSRVAELAAKGRGVRPYPDCELTAPRCRTAPSQQEL